MILALLLLLFPRNCEEIDTERESDILKVFHSCLIQEDRPSDEVYGKQ